ncbi:MAG: translational GTPase TypA [Planctomycetes bacterium]|nr:translational GTPase TypA [Planctomycetota bacterium]
MNPQKIRNVAIIAHVDHGKTSLLDGLLKDASVFRENQVVNTCVMDSHDIERERGITIFSKACSIEWKGHRLNVIDTPGHADFGGEVERVLRMADAALVVVCAHDGPMPQTRFVLRKALMNGLKLMVVVNKVDRKDSRAEEVPDELLGLLIDLGADEEMLESPIFYASAKEGRVSTTLEGFETAENFEPLLDALIEHAPHPDVDLEGPLRMAVSQLDWDDYVGRIALGQIESGSIRPGDRVLVVNANGKSKRIECKKLFRYAGLERIEIPEAGAGDIAFISGLDDIEIGDTVCAIGHPNPYPAFTVDPPTVAMRFIATNSPFRGLDGDRITSRQLRDRLMREARANVALEVHNTDTTEQLDVRGRGLLHLGILVEEMRREGYEFSVSRPQVIEKIGEDGERLEPIEDCVVDVVEAHAGKAIELLGARRGEMTSMTPRGDQVRVEFVIPARGLIGIRTPLLNATQGEAVLSHQFREYGPWRGPMPRRKTGVQIAMERGRVTAHAIEALESRGQLFVSPGAEVYAGMIVGDHRRPDDLEVNICKKRQLTNMRAASADRKVVLAAPRTFGIEEALAYLAEDELLEVTPKSIRLRKYELNATVRRRAVKKAKADAEKANAEAEKVKAEAKKAKADA